MVKLKDIAVRVGVSVMTVSKALRDGHDISAKTKTRIKLVAQQLGYLPDSSAQVLRTRKTKLFGLAISTLTNPIFSRVVLAIEERAHELGYEVLLAHTLNKPEREESCIRRFISRRVDGIFLCPVYRMATEARIYQELAARQVPVVLLGHSAPFCNQFVNVESDDLLGSYTATQHLTKLGHRRIAFLSGPAGMPWSQERFDGYRRALREVGTEVDDKLIFHAGRTIEDGTKAAMQMINESSDATAVQTVSDLVAVGCAEALMSQGLRIPEDISIVGFGNLLLATYYRIPLTTVRQPKFRLGSAAMDSMVQLMRGQKVEPKRLSAELIVRSSSGIPSATHRLGQLKTTSKETTTTL